MINTLTLTFPICLYVNASHLHFVSAIFCSLRTAASLACRICIGQRERPAMHALPFIYMWCGSAGNGIPNEHVNRHLPYLAQLVELSVLALAATQPETPAHPSRSAEVSHDTMPPRVKRPRLVPPLRSPAAPYSARIRSRHVETYARL